MSTQDKGSQAFPSMDLWSSKRGEWVADGSQGMTLRDYFAAKAMAAMISTAAAPCLMGLDGIEPHTAGAAYAMADEMLKARES